MPIGFFTTWELWQKLTFVLGCAIVGVFAIGFIKLWWTERYVRMQTLLDEEKRRTIADLRKNGQLIERKTSMDIPFGVRAIESGIEVDGIWISRSNTPVPESLRAARSADQSSASSIMTRSNASVGSITPPALPSPAIETPVSHHPSLALQDQQASAGTRPAARSPVMGPRRSEYKPWRSSQLRFSSCGTEKGTDEETLRKLEGKPSQRATLAPPTHRRQGSTPLSVVIDSEADAADNERVSNSSSDSQQTKSSHGKIIRHGSVQYHPVYSDPSEEADVRAHADATESAAMVVDVRNGDYSAIPTTENVSLNKSPNASTKFSSARESTPKPPVLPVKNPRRIPAIDSTDPDHSAYSRVPLLSQRRRYTGERPAYGSGEVHANKVARRVNSSFQILPAGTFGPRKEFEMNIVTLDSSGDSMTEPEETVWMKSPRNDARKSAFMEGKRKSAKLQKKRRNSTLQARTGFSTDPAWLSGRKETV